MRPLIALWLLVLSSMAVPAFAEDNHTAARALGEAALALYEDAKYEEAYKRFEMAEALVHAPPLLLFMARCKRAIGQLLAARELYARVTGESLPRDAEPAFIHAQKEAKQELATLDESIPRLQIAVEGAADAQVKVDGAEQSREALREPLPLDPGTHEIVATAPGVKPARATVELAEGGGVQRVSLTLGTSETSPDIGEPPERKGSLVPAAVCFAVGGAALAVGIATGVIALQKFDELESHCVDGHCPPEDEPLKEDVDIFATVSTVGFVVAGVGIVAGTVLAIVRPGGGSAKRSEIRVGAGSLSFVQRF